MPTPESVKETSLADLLSLVYDPNEKYSAETKIKACMAYIVTGSFEKSAKTVGIKSSTLRKWKQECHWWPEVMSTLRREKQDELDGKMTGIIHDILETLQGKVSDKAFSQKATLKDLTWAFGVIFDKRGMMRGDVGHKSSASTEQQLKEIHSKFQALSQEIQGKMDKINSKKEVKSDALRKTTSTQTKS